MLHKNSKIGGSNYFHGRVALLLVAGLLGMCFLILLAVVQNQRQFRKETGFDITQENKPLDNYNKTHGNVTTRLPSFPDVVPSSAPTPNPTLNPTGKPTMAPPKALSITASPTTTSRAPTAAPIDITNNSGHWIPLTTKERLEYERREKHVCGHPLQHCCLGQCRQLPSKHSNASALYTKWNLPLADLSTVLDYMGQHNIPCNLWFIGHSLSADQAIGALCELMRDSGYELDTTSPNYQEECVAYANSRWDEGNALNCSRTNGGEVGQPTSQYYKLVHRPQEGQTKESGCPVVTIAHSGIGRVASNESYHYTQHGGVMIWNYGVDCNKRGVGCISKTMNQSIAAFMQRTVTTTKQRRWYSLWRETERQHYAASNGYHSMARRKMPCQPLVEQHDEDDWRNEEAKTFLDHLGRSMNQTIPIIPLAKASESLYFMHGMDKEDTYDCTHYCYSPWRFHMTWDGILKGLKQLQ